MTDITYMEIPNWRGASRLSGNFIDGVCHSIDDRFPGTQIIAPSIWNYPKLEEEYKRLGILPTQYVCSHIMPTVERAIFLLDEDEQPYANMFERMVCAFKKEKPAYGMRRDKSISEFGISDSPEFMNYFSKKAGVDEIAQQFYSRNC